MKSQMWEEPRRGMPPPLQEEWEDERLPHGPPSGADELPPPAPRHEMAPRQASSVASMVMAHEYSEEGLWKRVDVWRKAFKHTNTTLIFATRHCTRVTLAEALHQIDSVGTSLQLTSDTMTYLKDCTFVHFFHDDRCDFED